MVSIYEFGIPGRTFRPDFVLFMKEKGKEEPIYQIFIEAKGEVFVGSDKWKEDFLLEIGGKHRIGTSPKQKYKIFGVKFYTKTLEDASGAFQKDLLDKLDLNTDE